MSLSLSLSYRLMLNLCFETASPNPRRLSAYYVRQFDARPVTTREAGEG
jgi:hypothetical protein